jgi:hypothetical protein
MFLVRGSARLDNSHDISLKLPAFSSTFKARQALPLELTKPVP